MIYKEAAMFRTVRNILMATALFVVGEKVTAQNIDYKQLDTANEKQRENYLKDLRKKVEKTPSQYYGSGPTLRNYIRHGVSKKLALEYDEADSCVKMIETSRYEMGDVNQYAIEETITRKDRNRNSYFSDTAETNYKNMVMVFNVNPGSGTDKAEKKGILHRMTVLCFENKSGNTLKMAFEDRRQSDNNGNPITGPREGNKGYSNTDSTDIDILKLYTLWLENTAKGFVSNPDNEGTKNIAESITLDMLERVRRTPQNKP
jgi:hypothetical protein